MKYLSILCLEDNEFDVELIKANIEAKGIEFDLQHVETRAEFIKALKNGPITGKDESGIDGQFDIILTDYSLPTFDGISALTLAAEMCPGVPVIMVSGTIGEEIAIETIKRGATDYVLKQRMERLAPTIIRALEEAEEYKARKLAEEALQESEEQLQTLINAMPDFVCFKDGEGRWLTINDAGTQIFRLESIDYQGKTDSELAELNSQLQGTFLTCQKSDARAWEEGSLIKAEETISHPDGSARIYDVTKVPVFHPCGERKGLIVLGHDITERVQAEEALRKYTHQLETLNTVTAALSSSLELDTVLELILTQIAQVLPFDSGSIFLHEKDGLRVVMDHGNNPSVKGRVFPAENELFEEIQRTKIPLVLDNVKEYPRFQNFGQSENIASWMGVPLIVRDTMIGHLTFDNDSPGAYTSEQAELVQPFAAQAAQAIENARLFEEITTRNAELFTIYQTSQQLQALQTPKSLANEIIEVLEETLNYEYCSILLIDKPNKQLTTFALSHQKNTLITNKEDRARIFSLKIPIGKGISGSVATTGQTICIEDVHQDPRYFSVANANIRSELCVPLKVRDQIIGVVNVESSQINHYTASDQRVLETVASQIAIAIQNAQLLEETQHRMEWLNTLHKIDQAITSNFELENPLTVILDCLLAQLEVDAAAVLRYEKDLQVLTFFQGQGFHTTALQNKILPLGEELAGKVALQRQPRFVPDIEKSEKCLSEPPGFKEEEFIAYYGVPLIAKGELMGVLEIFHRSDLNPNDEWENYMQVLAGQAAIAIENSTLFNDLQNSNLNLVLAYDATIEGWARVLEMRDMETEGHSRRVVDLTMNLAQTLGIRGEKLAHIRRGALLHDIGKMAVPDAILQKPGKLNEEEWRIMRLHPVYAFEWLSPIEYLRPALDIPYCHHEKWDGSGYPRGLQGEQIPLEARIFAVVDVWDALRSDRPYRKAWSKEKTLTYIKEQSGKYFDPQVVEEFLKTIDE